jgi:hypothetical protein
MSEHEKQSGQSTRTKNDRWMFGYLRSVRAACQYLQGRIADTRQKAASMPEATRPAFLITSLNEELFGEVNEKVAAQLNSIDALFAEDVTEFEWAADIVTSIDLIWAQITESYGIALGTTTDRDLRFKDIGDALDRIVFHCESLTLSPHINDAMHNLRVGQPLDIEFEFGNDFPKNPDLRERLIEEIAQESVVIQGGVVDAEQGIIFKVVVKRSDQVMSSVHLLGWLLGGFAFPFALAFAGKWLKDWPFNLSDLRMLITNYVLILIGCGAHFAVEALRSAKTKGQRPSFQALNDWVLWVHIREWQIFKGIAYVWLGYILLSFGIRPLSWSSAFFAGYSIDSVTELFLGRFDAVVAKQTKSLTASTDK